MNVGLWSDWQEKKIISVAEKRTIRGMSWHTEKTRNKYISESVAVGPIIEEIPINSIRWKFKKTLAETIL